MFGVRAGEAEAEAGPPPGPPLASGLVPRPFVFGLGSTNSSHTADHALR